MNIEYIKNTPIIYKLVLLWVFIETGLGGFLHLFHIPVTGWIVGACSVLINVLIAKFSFRNSKLVILSIGLVLLAKFSFNPFSPLGAYIAVGFQGITALLLFDFFKVSRGSILLYSCLVMIENAIQKPLIIYLIFGEELFVGLKGCVKYLDAYIPINAAYFYILIIIYIVLYMIWGVLVGLWTNHIIVKIQNFSYPSDFKLLPDISVNNLKTSRYVSFKYGMIFVILTCLYLFLKPSFDYIIKTILYVLVYVFFVPILFKFIFRIFFRNYSSQLTLIKTEIPQIKSIFQSSVFYYKHLKGFDRLQKTIILFIYSCLFYESE